LFQNRRDTLLQGVKFTFKSTLQIIKHRFHVHLFKTLVVFLSPVLQ